MRLTFCTKAAALGFAAATLSAFAPVDRDAALANAAYGQGAASGVSPMTASEMALCHAHWDRWHYAAESSNNAQFNGGLIAALSSKSAKKAAAHWLKKSKSSYRRYEDSMDGFADVTAEANEQADKAYANWVNGEDAAVSRFASTLGTCAVSAK